MSNVEQMMADNTDSNAKSSQERGRAAIASAAQTTGGAIEEAAGRMADTGHSARAIAEHNSGGRDNASLGRYCG